jgi:hypothetical protein
MAIAPQKVSSPDGRTWTLTSSRQRPKLKESYEKPFFWAHVVVTAIIVVVFVLVIRSDWVGILSILVPLVVILWLVGFVNSTLRVTISADTNGPPRDHRLWLVLKRFRLERSLREVAEAIEQGRYTSEPAGTRLEEI